MAKKKVSKLNAKVIKSATKKEFAQKKINVEIDGESYEVLVDQVFKTSKIQDMVTEGMEKFKDFQELSPTIQVGYFSYLMLKYFSSIDLSEVKGFEQDIAMMNNLLDLGIFDKVVAEFPEEEIKKVNQYMLDFTKRIKEFIADEKGQKELEDVIAELSPEVKQDAEQEIENVKQ